MALLSTRNTGMNLTVRRLDLMRFDCCRIASFMLLFSYSIKHPKISSPEAFWEHRTEVELTSMFSASLFTLKKNKIMVKKGLLVPTYEKGEKKRFFFEGSEKLNKEEL